MSINQNYSSDEEICSIEIIQYNELVLSKDEIVKAAAVKLEESGKYTGELNRISAVISRLFPAFSSSTVSIALDQKYKRNYETAEPSAKSDNPDNSENNDTPLSKFEEFLFLLEDNFLSFNKVIKVIIKQVHNNPEMARDMEGIFTKTIHNFHDELPKFIKELKGELFDINNLDGLIEYTKQLGINIKFMESQTDWRVLLDTATRFGLRLQFTQWHFKDLIDEIKTKGDAKPETKDLDKSSTFHLFLDKLLDCPCCSFDYSDFITKYYAAEKIDSKAKLPKFPKLKDLITAKCKSCNSKDIALTKKKK